MGKAELKIDIDADLLAEAEASGRSIEELIAEGLRIARAQVSDERASRWAEENAEAITDYNRRISERGLIGDKFRTW
jgi:post-segregation antitoxin (ccd killing protein)